MLAWSPRGQLALPNGLSPSFLSLSPSFTPPGFLCSIWPPFPLTHTRLHFVVLGLHPFRTSRCRLCAPMHAPMHAPMPARSNARSNTCCLGFFCRCSIHRQYASHAARPPSGGRCRKFRRCSSRGPGSWVGRPRLRSLFLASVFASHLHPPSMHSHCVSQSMNSRIIARFLLACSVFMVSFL